MKYKLSRVQLKALSILNRGFVAKLHGGHTVYVNQTKIGLVSTMRVLEERGYAEEVQNGHWKATEKGQSLFNGVSS